MNKQVIIVLVAVFILLLAGYLFFRYLLPQFTGGQNGREQNARASSEAIEEVLGAKAEDSGIIGETLFIDRNRVVAVPGENALWLAPIGGTKSVLIVENSETEFSEEDVVSVKGEIRQAGDFIEQSADWVLTNGDLELIRNNPIVVEASEIEVIN